MNYLHAAECYCGDCETVEDRYNRDAGITVYDCTTPVDLRNCGVTTPANWAAPELRAQQQAMRKEQESVFNVSAAEKKALQARPIDATLFDIGAEPKRTPAPVSQWAGDRRNAKTIRDHVAAENAAHANAAKRQENVRKIASTLGIILK